MEHSIDREKVMNGLKCIKGDLVLCVDCGYSDDNGHGGYHCRAFCANDAIELLKEQETVEHACEILRANGWKETEPICSECDAVHVIQCKDCVECYFASNRIQSEQTFVCGKHEIVVAPDWFCADGERKTK